MNLQSFLALDAIKNADMEQLILLQAITDVDPPDSKPKIAGPAEIVRFNDARQSYAKEALVYFGPSETPTSGVTVHQTTSNLFDISQITESTDYVNLTVNGESFSVENQNRIQKANALYGFSIALSAGSYTMSIARSLSKNIAAYGEGGKSYGIALASNQTSGTFTLDTDDTITFSLLVDYGGYYTFDHLKLEYGTSATAYQPKQGRNYNVNFGLGLEDLYGGTIDLVTGELTVTHDLVGGELHELDEPLIFNISKTDVQLYSGGNVFSVDNGNRIRVRYTAKK